MKKITKLISLVWFASVFALVSCSSPSSSGASVTYIGTKTPTEAKEVGDIVFNDGSATPYSVINAREDVDPETNSKITKTEKAAAIAVIFYVGTGCSNDTLPRTLGVGLKHYKQALLSWCRYESEDKYAAAFNVKISPIVCKLDEGISDFTGDKYGKDNYSQLISFLAKKGHKNEDKEGNYPAFEFGKKYSTNATSLTEYDAKDWYLPSIAELDKIYKEKSMVDSASELCGGDKFGQDEYWSSSQSDTDDNAIYTVSFGNELSWKRKGSVICHACAIREF